MDIVGILLFFLLGAFAGSFDNLVVYRRFRSKSLFFPKKFRCELCKHDLSMMETLPIISYFAAGGRCRYCDEKIHIKHPILEAVTGVLFVILFLQYGWTLKTFAGCVMTCALMINFLADWEYGQVIDNVAYIAMGIGLICSAFTNIGLASAVIGVLIFAFIYGIIFFFSKGTMGGGDMKLAGVIGAFSGLPGVFLTFLISSFMAAVVAVIRMLLLRKRKRGGLRFSPFLLISGFLAYTYTIELVNLYVSFFPAK